MEATTPLRRINNEGRGMSAATQEYDMKINQMFSVAAVATVLALASPAYAGQLAGAGGLGGNFGGNLGGNLGGLDGASRLGGAGGFDSHDDLSGSVNKKPISKKVDGTATSAAQASGGGANSATQSTGGVTNSVTQTTTGATSTNAAADASKSLNAASTASATNDAAAKSASAAPAPAKEKPATTAPAPAKPSASSSLAGSADQTVTAGRHSASGGANGSLDAQHSRGSTSTAANGDASGSLN
jgi:hypothetical protein